MQVAKQQQRRTNLTYLRRYIVGAQASPARTPRNKSLRPPGPNEDSLPAALANEPYTIANDTSTFVDINEYCRQNIGKPGAQVCI